jgi:hypothetical protein
MWRLLKFPKDFLLWNRRMTGELERQKQEGYKIELINIGPERYIVYTEKGKELEILANFTFLNGVILYSDSLKLWTKPPGEELSPFDFRKVLNRTIRYLSCWGAVTVDDRSLLVQEDFKKDLIQRGIRVTELHDGVMKYEIAADGPNPIPKEDEISRPRSR